MYVYVCMYVYIYLTFSNGQEDLFSQFIYISRSLWVSEAVESSNTANFLSKLVCKYSLFHLKPAPVTDGNCSKTSTWVVNYGKLSYLFLFVTAG